jgi:hypothetical protein
MFSLVANFTNVVSIPPDALPQKPEDLEICAFGFFGPAGAHLLDHKGTEFWIHHGAIQGYRSAGAYFGQRAGHKMSEFGGTFTVTSNELVQIGEKAIRRMTKKGDPLAHGPPWFRRSGSEQIPFVEISWPKSGPGSDTAAQVQIDGRTGTIVALHVRGSDFYDPAFEKEMRQKANIPEPVYQGPSAPMRLHTPPATNYVNVLVPKWLAFCNQLGVDPGGQTNIGSVDWDDSDAAPTRGPKLNKPGMDPDWEEYCRIAFKSGASFTARDGVVCCYGAPDSHYTLIYRVKPKPEGNHFRGKVTKRWQDLAKDLEHRISAKLRVPESYFATTQPTTSETREGMPAGLGETGPTHVFVFWKNPAWAAAASGEKPRLDAVSALWAEFDLESGKVEAIGFADPRKDWDDPLLKAVRRISGL